jgi:CheY-like chemotaxis protein
VNGTLHGLRVLLVDDNVHMLETMSDVLHCWGARVDTAADVHTAVVRFEQQAYDAAVVDMVMPGMSGIELIRLLRPAHPGTVFVILTAYADRRSVQQACTDENVPVLFKPVDLEELLRLLSDATGAAAARQGGAARATDESWN